MEPEVVEVQEQAIVAARVTEQGNVGRVVMPLFDRVWAFLRQSDLPRGHNVIVYRSGANQGFEIVEAGVQVFGESQLPEGLVASTTPAGKAATALHVGLYSGLAASTAELRSWCAANALKPSGPSWEVYGDWDEDTSKLETHIYILLEDDH